MKLEARDALDDRGLGHEDGPRRIETRLEGAECSRREKHGLDGEPAMLEQTLDDEAAFRDEEALLLEPRRIADMAVVLQTRVVGSTDVGDQSSFRWTERRLRWLSITCWPSRLLRKTLDSPLSTGCGTKRTTSNASWASVLRIS